eukprot:s503_g17.t1
MTAHPSCGKRHAEQEGPPVGVNAASCGWVQRRRLLWIAARRAPLHDGLTPPEAWCWVPAADGADVHSRVRHPMGGILSIDVAGPMKPAYDQGGGTARRFSAGALTWRAPRGATKMKQPEEEALTEDAPQIEVEESAEAEKEEEGDALGALHTCLPHLPPTPTLLPTLVSHSLGRMILHLSPTCTFFFSNSARWLTACVSENEDSKSEKQVIIKAKKTLSKRHRS